MKRIRLLIPIVKTNIGYCLRNNGSLRYNIRRTRTATLQALWEYTLPNSLPNNFRKMHYFHKNRIRMCLLCNHRSCTFRYVYFLCFHRSYTFRCKSSLHNHRSCTFRCKSFLYNRKSLSQNTASSMKHNHRHYIPL